MTKQTKHLSNSENHNGLSLYLLTVIHIHTQFFVVVASLQKDQHNVRTVWVSTYCFYEDIASLDVALLSPKLQLV